MIAGSTTQDVHKKPDVHVSVILKGVQVNTAHLEHDLRNIGFKSFLELQ